MVAPKLIHPAATPVNDRESGPFYLKYSLNGRHFMVGPYKTRRFALSHMDDVRRINGVSNVSLGKENKEEKTYRRLLPITAIISGAMLASMFAMRVDVILVPDWWGLWMHFPGAC